MTDALPSTDEPVSSEESERLAVAWSDYRRDYGVSAVEAMRRREHRAFAAGWSSGRDDLVESGALDDPDPAADDAPAAPASADEPTFQVQVCVICKRERTRADVYDYNPLQVIMGQPLGWYSADDGEICPECMTHTLRTQ